MRLFDFKILRLNGQYGPIARAFIKMECSGRIFVCEQIFPDEILDKDIKKKFYKIARQAAVRLTEKIKKERSYESLSQ